MERRAAAEGAKALPELRATDAGQQGSQAVSQTYAEYDKLPGINWSRLRSLAISPKRFRYDCTHPRAETAYFRVGRAMHCYVLERDDFSRLYIPYEGVRRGKVWEEFKEKNASATILSADEYVRAVGAAEAILRHPVASSLIESGYREHVIRWTDQETGIECRGRLDLANGKLVDLKSAADLHPRRFPAKAVNLGYLSQLAWYLDGYVATGAEVEDEPILIVVESVPPHDVVVYRVPANVLEIGRTEYRRLLCLLRDCQIADYWPGQAEDIVELVVPEWAWHRDPLDLVIDDELVSL
jgi:PDDEXK-like uncharacterized protein DUF3799